MHIMYVGSYVMEDIWITCSRGGEWSEPICLYHLYSNGDVSHSLENYNLDTPIISGCMIGYVGALLKWYGNIILDSKHLMIISLSVNLSLILD